MANWSQNKIVGIVAAVVLVLCLVVIIRVIVSMRPARVPSTVEQVRSIEPGAKIFIPEE